MKDFMSPWLAVHLTPRGHSPIETCKSGGAIDMDYGRIVCDVVAGRGVGANGEVKGVIFVCVSQCLAVCVAEQWYLVWVQWISVENGTMTFFNHDAWYEGWFGQLPAWGISSVWHHLSARGHKPTCLIQGQCVSPILQRRGQGIAVLVFSPPPPLLASHPQGVNPASGLPTIPDIHHLLEAMLCNEFFFLIAAASGWL